MKRGPALVAMLAVLFPAAARAQAPRVSSIPGILPQDRLRVKRGPTLLDGHLDHADSATLFLDVGMHRHELPLASGDSVWVFHNGPEGLGLTLGIFAGLFIGGEVAGHNGWLEEGNPHTTRALLAIFSGAAVCGVAGAAIGRGASSWQLVYPAR